MKSPLLTPGLLFGRTDVLVKECPVPRDPGVYAWYFRTIPPGVPSDGCVIHPAGTLLYAGISPKRPPANGAPPSRQSLRSRIRSHFCGNASRSTLRFTLGCLLEPVLGTVLRRVGSGGRYTFADREAALSAWMEANAFVTWLPTKRPWELEEQLIAAVSLPLNLDQNRHHSFHPMLASIRKAARERADRLPICRGP